MDGLHKFMLFQVLTCVGRIAHGSDIINGEKAPESSMLYMASVQNATDHRCGGFLISEDFVMTAAHCDDNKPTYVVLGTHNLKKRHHEKILIEEKCKHPSYERPGLGNDIMLLKLSTKAQVGSRVQIIQLPTCERNVQENEECQVAGWGMTRTGGPLEDQLRVVNVSVMSRNDCAKKWDGLPDKVICAGGYPADKGFCQGDSGGPLVCKGMAVGVVSFNYEDNCHYPHVPNVYMDVSKQLQWIIPILQRGKC